MKKGIVLGVVFLFVMMSFTSISGIQIDKNIIIPSGRGNILYVGGSGPGNYTKIQGAIDDASKGDTVFVYDDSSPYVENVFVNKSINLLGEDKNTTIIDGNSIGDVVYVSADLVAIRGFTIQNSGDYSNNYLDIYDAGLEIISNNNIICDNIIANNNLMGVILDGSSDNEYISENIITNNYASGIIIAKSSNNNRIFGNSITNNKDAGCRIILSSNNNNISKNTIKNNSVDGVVLIEADENGIYNNKISNNGDCGLEIEFYNCNNTISGNIIMDNSENGIDLHYLSNNNLILQNTIKNNRRGIDITISYDNFIYHNNFINNLVNAQDYGNNIWDDGEFGNYWSDYKQIYPNAKRIWLKGIWDVPYEITGGGNNDSCPLIKQWSKSLSRAMPREKATDNMLLLRFLERFSLIERFLTLLMN